MRKFRTKTNNSGFTLVEIIVVLVILALLAGAAIPSYIKYIDDARALLCYSNLGLVMRDFEYSRILDPDVTLDDIAEAHAGEKLCPAGGIFSVQDGALVCSIHGSGEGGESMEGKIKLPDGTYYDITDDWGNAIDKVKTEVWSLSIPGKTFLSDDTGLYLATTPFSISRGSANSTPTLAGYLAANPFCGLVQVDTESPALTSDSYSISSGVTVWDAGCAPKKGSIMSSGGKLYVCMQTWAGDTTPGDVSNTSIWLAIP